MNSKGIETKIQVLRDNLARLAAIPQRPYAEFAADFRNIDSTIHRLQTSIQALIDVGSYKIGRRGLAPPDTSRDILALLERDSALPAGTADRFAPLFTFRNRVVHLYDRMDPQRVSTSSRNTGRTSRSCSTSCWRSPTDGRESGGS